MKKSKLFSLIAFATSLSVACISLQAASTKDKYKADSCQNAEGKKVSCDDKSSTNSNVMYPNATRIAPEFPNTKIGKEWQDFAKTVEAADPNSIVIAAKEIIANPKASNNEISEAAYQAAISYLKIDKTIYSNAIEYAEIAINKDGLNNNQQYSLMLLLSQMQLAQKNYEQALATINRFSKETSVEDLAVEKVRGNCLYRLGRFSEAAPALQKAYDLDKGADPNLGTMLMDSYVKTGQKEKADKITEQAMADVDPNDSSAQLRQLQVLANAKQYDKASQAFDTLYAEGKITNLAGYEAGYISYLNQEGKEATAAKIINDGIAKGIIIPDATIYNLLGQANYYSNNPEAAIKAWSKGSAIAKDGQQNRMLAQIYCEESQYSECKSEAQKALTKGVKDKGDVYLLIAEAESEFGLNNNAAMVAALREAAKYPESKDSATKQLKQAGVK